MRLRPKGQSWAAVQYWDDNEQEIHNFVGGSDYSKVEKLDNGSLLVSYSCHSYEVYKGDVLYFMSGNLKIVRRSNLHKYELL